MVASTDPHSSPQGQTAVEAQLGHLRILPLAALDANNAVEVGHVLVEAGLPGLEIVFRNDTAPQAIEQARTVSGLMVGAGTVLSTEDAKRAADAGASFALSPVLSELVVDCCRDLGLPFFPGVATPTEIDRALQLGLRVLKAFPIVALGGASFLSNIAATFPEARFIPTGGVNAANAHEFLDMENVVACGGSWLISEDSLRHKRYEELAATVRAAKALTAVHTDQGEEPDVRK